MAFNPASGGKLWTYVPPGYLPNVMSIRGLSSWSGARGDYRALYFYGRELCEVNADTGAEITHFDAYKGLERDHPEMIGNNSPPLVIGNTAIYGSMIRDNVRVAGPSGAIQAIDILSSKRLWSFDPIPRNSKDPARSTWSGHGAGISGSANMWSFMSYDAARGLLYVPTSSPSCDTYGGTRKGSNLYANSIVCLDMRTGRRRWSFQVVHHDIFDYDIASQPVLFDTIKAGRPLHGIAVATKMGRLFLFDRVTGKPLFPVREVPVPKSGVPGESAYPTQPLETLPPPLSAQSVSVADAWGRTPAEHAMSRKLLASHVTGPIFTPPSEVGTVQVPGDYGGCNWSGMSYDKRDGLIITTTNNFALIAQLIRKKPGETVKPSGWGGEIVGSMIGTPYRARGPWMLADSPLGKIPLTKPPFGTIAAVDPVSGKIRWQKPLGYCPGASSVPGYKSFGSPNLGGVMTTSTGLTFVAASEDDHLRAFDSLTGRKIAEWVLPAGGNSLPMSYAVNGRRYIAICCGGSRAIGNGFGDYIESFSLPS